MLGLMVFVLVSASDSPPGPKPIGDPLHWVSNDDYPIDAMRKDRGGRVEMEFTIDPTGHAILCRVLQSSGTDILDKTACAAYIRRGRWEPELDERGVALYSIYRRTIIWTMPNVRAKPSPLPFDIEVDVGKLPVAEDMARVIVRQTQDSSGGEEGCVVAQSSPSPALDRVACRLAKPLISVFPVTDAAGKLVRAVRWRTVQFRQAGTTANAASKGKVER